MSKANFAEGSYGCVFYPRITCKGIQEDEYDNYISKIVRKNFYGDTEIMIGKHIREQLPWHWNNFFAPAIHSCDIDISKFSNINLEKCDIVQRFKKSPFMLLKIPFIGYKSYYSSYQDYIVQNINPREIVLNLIAGYKHLLQALIELQKDTVKVCHFDLNETNILFSQNQTVPIIIDFNLSFTPSRVTNHLKDYFYIYAPEYSTWALEIHYINFILYENDTPSHREKKEIAHKYVNYNRSLQINFSKEFLKNYEEICVDVLEEYRNGVFEIIDIINKCWKTWDNYSLSIMYLRIIYYLNINFKNNIPVKSFISNSFTVDFTKLLLRNIHPNPRFRYDVTSTKNKFTDFFYDENINNISNFQQILTQFESGKNNLEQIVSEDKYQMQKLLKKIGISRTKGRS